MLIDEESGDWEPEDQLGAAKGIFGGCCLAVLVWAFVLGLIITLVGDVIVLAWIARPF